MAKTTIKQNHQDIVKALDEARDYLFKNVVPVDLLDFNVNLCPETGEWEDGFCLEITHEYVQRAWGDTPTQELGEWIPSYHPQNDIGEPE